MAKPPYATWPPAAVKSKGENLTQPASELDGRSLQRVVGEIPGGHKPQSTRYLSAVRDRLRHADDRSSIGIILCKSRAKVTVEYALRDTRKPIGVSEYRLTEALPQELKPRLPTIEELEEELKTSGAGGGDGMSVVSPLGSLPAGWQLARLDDIATKVGYRTTPKGGAPCTFQHGRHTPLYAVKTCWIDGSILKGWHT